MNGHTFKAASRLLAGSVLLLVGSMGCKEKEPPVSETAADSPPPLEPSPAPAATVAEPVVDAAAIPTSEDFEEEASQGVSAKNLDAELAKLENEVASR